MKARGEYIDGDLYLKLFRYEFLNRFFRNFPDVDFNINTCKKKKRFQLKYRTYNFNNKKKNNN